jgi:hypothetical protein
VHGKVESLKHRALRVAVPASQQAPKRLGRPGQSSKSAHDSTERQPHRPANAHQSVSTGRLLAHNMIEQ